MCKSKSNRNCFVYILKFLGKIRNILLLFQHVVYNCLFCFLIGRVTNFKYGDHLASAFRRYFPIADLRDFGEAWGPGMYPSGKTLKTVVIYK